MRDFCICYNLTNKEQNYTEFFAELKKDGWAHLHSGTVLVTTSENALQLQERLRPNLSLEDSLFICQVHKGEYSGWATQPYWNWIKKNIR